MTRSATTLASWTAVLVQALSAKGVETGRLLREVGIDAARLYDPDARFPVAQTLHLWRLAEDVTGDPLIGLEMARFVTPMSFHALGYMLLSCSTMGQMLDWLTRYGRMVTEGGEVQVLQHDRHVHIDLRLPPGVLPPHCAVDALMCVLLAGCRKLVGRSLQPVSLEMVRPPPGDAPRFAAAFPKAQLAFGAARNRITFERWVLDLPTLWRNPELARANASVVMNYLARVNRDDVCNRVRLALVEMLPKGEPSQAEVARELSLSVRNMQRRLADAGSSFTALLNETRREQACLLLRGDCHSMSEIAYQLGFAEPSTFSRAFTRWMGCSPSEWRRQGRNDKETGPDTM